MLLYREQIPSSWTLHTLGLSPVKTEIKRQVSQASEEKRPFHKPRFKGIWFYFIRLNEPEGIDLTFLYPSRRLELVELKSYKRRPSKIG